MADRVAHDRSMLFLPCCGPPQWCGHCKQLAPVFKGASERAGPDAAQFATVDCTLAKAVAAEEGIRGYPTLKLFIDGRAHEVAGPRTVKALAQVAVRATSDPIAEAEGQAELDAVLAATDGPVLAVGPGTDRILDGSFKNIASAWRHEQSFVRLGEGKPGVWRLEQGAEPVAYLGQHDAVSLEKWARAPHQRFAALLRVDATNFAAVVNSGLPVAAAIVDHAAPSSRRFLSAYAGLAATSGLGLPPGVRSSFVFAHLDGVLYAEALKQYNVSPDALPRVIVIDGGAKTFYEDPRVREVSDVPSFLAEVAAGDFPAQRTGAWKYPTAVYNAVLFGENGMALGAGLAVGLAVFIGLVVFVTAKVCADDEAVHDDEAERVALDQATLQAAEESDGDDEGDYEEGSEEEGEPAAEEGEPEAEEGSDDDADAKATVRRRAVAE